jgi:hypothetical protein
MVRLDEKVYPIRLGGQERTESVTRQDLAFVSNSAAVFLSLTTELCSWIRPTFYFYLTLEKLWTLCESLDAFICNHGNRDSTKDIPTGIGIHRYQRDTFNNKQSGKS